MKHCRSPRLCEQLPKFRWKWKSFDAKKIEIKNFHWILFINVLTYIIRYETPLYSVCLFECIVLQHNRTVRLVLVPTHCTSFARYRHKPCNVKALFLIKKIVVLPVSDKFFFWIRLLFSIAFQDNEKCSFLSIFGNLKIVQWKTRKKRTRKSFNFIS